MPRLVSASALSRSSKTFGIETVVALKIRPPHAVATATTTNTRASSARGIRASVFFGATFRSSMPRLAHTNPKPAAMHSTPGTKNATRQPARSASAPVSSAANASPALPYTPFTPSVRPSCGWLATSIAMPTGW